MLYLVKKLLNVLIIEIEEEMKRDAQKLDACPRVAIHLAAGGSECPVNLFCDQCDEAETCGFYHTVPDPENPRTPWEIHYCIITRQNILTKLLEIKKRLEDVT
jgi:hypothetical protein